MIKPNLQRRLGPDPQLAQRYIRDLLCIPPNWPNHRALDLAPLNWAATAATEEVQGKLAANRFRQAVLSSRA
jgi:hypothetical protein